MAVFDLPKSAKINFTDKQSGRKIANFPQCGITIVKNSQLGCTTGLKVVGRNCHKFLFTIIVSLLRNSVIPFGKEKYSQGALLPIASQIGLIFCSGMGPTTLNEHHLVLEAKIMTSNIMRPFGGPIDALTTTLLPETFFLPNFEPNAGFKYRILKKNKHLFGQ